MYQVTDEIKGDNFTIYDHRKCSVFLSCSSISIELEVKCLAAVKHQSTCLVTRTGTSPCHTTMLTKSHIYISL